MTGKHLSHYLIESELGRGGMGIVYRALDTKLDRAVAIKVLPSAALASDEDRARFYREAKAAAGLNHANIAAVYGIDEAIPEDAPYDAEPSPFIAMELVDGAPLEERIREGPLPLEDAIRIGIQIANALQAAHEKNIVHRDIKAANVMLTSKGDAKVLDFGLAKTSQSTMLTKLGSTLGTIAYMSPEQARGEAVDHRADIWSLGVTIYQMISGSVPYASEYEQAAVYSILNEDPAPLTSLRTDVPVALEFVINKCLSKDAAQRYQSATELIVDLGNVIPASPNSTNRVLVHSTTGASMAAMPISGATTAITTGRANTGILAKIAAGTLLVLLGAAAVYFARPEPPRELRIYTETVPGLQSFALSNSGDRYAFVQNDTLYVREFSSVQPRPLTPAGSGQLFWSTDDSEIGFSQAGTLSKVSSIGGQPLELYTAPTGDIHGARWLPDSNILISIRSGTGAGEIRKIPASGGVGSVYRTTDRANDVASYAWLEGDPQSTVTYATVLTNETVNTLHLFSDEVDHRLAELRQITAASLALSTIGNLLYTDMTGLWSQALTADRMAFSGDPIRIAPPGAEFPSIGENKLLVYVQKDQVDLELARYSASWQAEERLGQPTPWLWDVLFHPDGNRVAVSTDGSLKIFGARGAQLPVATGHDIYDEVQAFLQDGKRMIFASFRNGNGELYTMDISGAEEPQLLVRTENSIWGASLSTDQKQLAFYQVTADNNRDLYFVDLDIDSESIRVNGDPQLFLSTPDDEAMPDIHPDGDLVLYQTNTSGRWEIEVRSFPNPNLSYWPATVNGGYRAKWHPSGKWIYFVDSEFMLHRIPFDRTSTAPVGDPEALFRMTEIIDDSYSTPYDFSPVTGELIAIRAVRPAKDPVLVFVENWDLMLKQ